MYVLRLLFLLHVYIKGEQNTNDQPKQGYQLTWFVFQTLRKPSSLVLQVLKYSYYDSLKERTILFSAWEDVVTPISQRVVTRPCVFYVLGSLCILLYFDEKTSILPFFCFCFQRLMRWKVFHVIVNWNDTAYDVYDKNVSWCLIFLTRVAENFKLSSTFVARILLQSCRSSSPSLGIKTKRPLSWRQNLNCGRYMMQSKKVLSVCVSKRFLQDLLRMKNVM